MDDQAPVGIRELELPDVLRLDDRTGPCRALDVGPVWDGARGGSAARGAVALVEACLGTLPEPQGCSPAGEPDAPASRAGTVRGSHLGPHAGDAGGLPGDGNVPVECLLSAYVHGFRTRGCHVARVTDQASGGHRTRAGT